MTMILLNYLDRVVLSIVSPVLRQELSLSQGQYALALNAFLAAYAVMYLGSGLLLDKVGSRFGLAIFVLIWSVVSGLHGLTTGLAGLVVFRFALGLAEPGGWTGAVKAVSERFSPSQRGLASGIFTAGAGLGALVAPPLVVFLMLRYGWRASFWITGAAGLIWLPFWWRATRGWPAAVPVRGPSVLSRLPDVLRDRRALAFAATGSSVIRQGYFFLFWLPEYLVTAKRFSLVSVGALAWIPFCWQDIGSILGGYGSGVLVRRGIAAVNSRKLMMSVAALFVILGTTLRERLDSGLGDHFRQPLHIRGRLLGGESACHPSRRPSSGPGGDRSRAGWFGRRSRRNLLQLAGRRAQRHRELPAGFSDACDPTTARRRVPLAVGSRRAAARERSYFSIAD